MAANELHALGRDRIGDLGTLLPGSSPALTVRLVEPLYVLSMRWLPGGGDAVAGAVAHAGIPSLPSPGRFTGDDPFVLWRNPTDLMFITGRPGVSERVLLELAPTHGSLAYAVDQSDGLIALELEGPALDEVLPRLMDASAVPLEPGHGTRTRMAEIAVIAVRLAPKRAWILADRAHDRYLAQWVAYATDALAALS
jgi:sarcosine oxidase gamma subunit